MTDSMYKEYLLKAEVSEQETNQRRNKNSIFWPSSSGMSN